MGMRGGTEMPDVGDLDVLGAVKLVAVPDEAAGKDVDNAAHVLWLILGSVLERIAAQVDKQIDRDVVLLGGDRQVAHEVGPETEADEHEAGLGVFSGDTMNF